MITVQKSFAKQGAKLYICSTPIGNLQDVTLRLLETLREVDIIAAEDTRHSRKLLAKYEIHSNRLISYHQHNALQKVEEFRAYWRQGCSIALISDAGTPGISDPGDLAVTAAVNEGVPVIPVPGPSALLSALVASALPVQPFIFLGFLPREQKKCQEELIRYQQFPGVLVIYEAPHRLRQTLNSILECFPHSKMTIAKELTKQHETFYYGKTAEFVEYFHQENPRGEFVLILERESKGEVIEKNQICFSEEDWETMIKEVYILIGQGVSRKDAVREIAIQCGVKRRELYNRVMEIDIDIEK